MVHVSTVVLSYHSLVCRSNKVTIAQRFLLLKIPSSHNSCLVLLQTL